MTNEEALLAAARFNELSTEALTRTLEARGQRVETCECGRPGCDGWVVRGPGCGTCGGLNIVSPTLPTGEPACPTFCLNCGMPYIVTV